MTAIRHLRLIAKVVFGTLCSLHGCSGDSTMSRSGVTAAVAGAGASRGAAGAQPVPSGATINTAPGSASAARGGVVDPGVDQCVGDTQGAEPVPVDMYIMLDRSGSMQGETGTGESKWEAMRRALTAFIADPASGGLGVGLQYFPLGADGVPDTCGSDSDCGPTGGECLNRVCQPPPFSASFSPMLCVSDADCPFNSPGCASLGLCEDDQTAACFDIGPTGCGTDGACEPIAGECSGYGSCEIADYQAPAVEIAVLPANAGALSASLAAERPIGFTPTGVALAGAINRATLHANANPGHQAIAVLATDGFPTECLPAGTRDEDQAVDAVASVAAQGFALTPSIRTYVIGVFGPDDPDPLSKLNRLALAGGTGNAFIVDSSQDVTQQLLEALATIRAGSLNCEFQLPTPPAGNRLDFMRVNVQVTSEGLQRDVLYVQSADRCDQAQLGWFYDADPALGATPRQIRTCPQTCAEFGGLRDASVAIRLGCATQIPD
jgi:hypothetical protein